MWHKKACYRAKQPHLKVLKRQVLGIARLFAVGGMDLLHGSATARSGESAQVLLPCSNLYKHK